MDSPDAVNSHRRASTSDAPRSPPSSPRIVYANPSRPGQGGRPRARSAAAELERQRRDRAREHLAHGTWQGGTFRAPWDKLTTVCGGGEDELEEGQDVDDGEDEKDQWGGTAGPKAVPMSPGLRYTPLSSGVDGSFSLAIDEQHAQHHPPTHNLIKAAQEQQEEEEDYLTALSTLQPPKSYKSHLLLTLLAEHFLDTLQPHIAIFIYMTYLCNDNNAYPPSALTYFNLGQLHLSNHDYIPALESFQLAVKKDPYEVASHVQIGLLYFLLCQFHAASDAYLTAALGMREAEKVGYTVLGLDVVIEKRVLNRCVDVCRELARREEHGEDIAGQGGLGGVWGIASNKIIRVREEKKRNLAKREYIHEGKVIAKVTPIAPPVPRVDVGLQRRGDRTNPRGLLALPGLVSAMTAFDLVRAPGVSLPKRSKSQGPGGDRTAAVDAGEEPLGSRETLRPSHIQ